MSLNYKEIEAVLTELNLEGSFIQQIVQPSFDTIAFHTYKFSSCAVFVCLAAGSCRIHETKRKIPKTEKPLRFMEFLKSRVKGCVIESCEQLNNDRIIQFTLKTPTERLFMFIRLWSGSANIIVTDENMTILDVFYRRPKRGEVTGGTFSIPTAIKKDDPTDEKKFEVRDFVDLTQDGIIEANKSVLHNKSFDELSFSEKIDIWYGEYGQSLSKEVLLEQAQKAYDKQKNRMSAALLRLEEKKQSFLHSENLKHFGDLLLANAHILVEQLSNDDVTKFFECEDYETGNIVRLEIDPKKSAQENAQNYYIKYKKSVSGIVELDSDIAKFKKEILDLDTAWQNVLREPNPIRLQQLLKKQTKPKQQIEKKHPGLSFTVNGWHILVGRTASENDELLRRHVKGHDMWLHTRDYPGGYVFIKNQKGKTVPLEVLLDAGNLAVFYSKARKGKTADLYYTQVKHLRRAKNGPKGTVLPSNEKNVTITLDDARLKKIEESSND